MRAASGAFSGPRVEQLPSLDYARLRYSGSCSGSITIRTRAPPDTMPFSYWTGSEWVVSKESASRHGGGKNGLPNHRAQKRLELGEEGFIISGPGYQPPEYLWNPNLEMEDELRGHYSRSVSSYGKRPLIIGATELGVSAVSILPSTSGGYNLTQESMSEDESLNSVALCMNKSRWRDRMVLEEGMIFEFGECFVRIMSISGRDRNQDLYSVNGKLRLREKDKKASKKKKKNAKKQVKFVESVVMETGETMASLAMEKNDNDSAWQKPPSSSLWVESNDKMGEMEVNAMEELNLKEGANPRLSTGRQRSALFLVPDDRPKLVLEYKLGSKANKKVAEFQPALPDSVPLPEVGAPIQSKTSFSSALWPSRFKKKEATGKTSFTIGGAATCDIVLPGCAVAVVATIVSFENVFTLICTHSLADTFHQGTRLSPAQDLFAVHTAVHLVLSPLQSFGLYDGDTIVFRGAPDSPRLKRSGCCSGLELVVQLSDPSERQRIKDSKRHAESSGIAWDVRSIREAWADRKSRTLAAAANEVSSHIGLPREVEDIAVEIRAPVRTGKWDGSMTWNFGETEAFSLQNLNSNDITVGSSPLMTVSIKDPSLARCHARIFKKGSRTFAIEAAMKDGKNPVLALAAASKPSGFISTSSPPHLLLPGEVFRVGATDFHVIGFEKLSEGERAGLFRSLTTKRRSTEKVSSVETGSDFETESEIPLGNDFRDEDNRVFQDLVSNAASIMADVTESQTSTPLIFHRPQDVEEAMRTAAVSTFVSEDDVKISVSNNVDRTFGLAQVADFQFVLSTFGLDAETRRITYPDLGSFLVIQAVKGPLQRRLFLINERECTIGSSPRCSITVENDPQISPIHCRIVYSAVEKHWHLIDAESRSGTLLRIAPDDNGVILQPGQRYLVGNTQMRVLARMRRKHESKRKSTITGIGLRRQIKSVFITQQQTLQDSAEDELRNSVEHIERLEDEYVDSLAQKYSNRSNSARLSKAARASIASANLTIRKSLKGSRTKSRTVSRPRGEGSLRSSAVVTGPPYHRKSSIPSSEYSSSDRRRPSRSGRVSSHRRPSRTRSPETPGSTRSRRTQESPTRESRHADYTESKHSSRKSEARNRLRSRRA
mmetsp:Transcript_20467/g.38060  ORF Transcript_20467/g.38060 Transcript_20467/m.38060 type:complete len:1116 (-) Transcript_20467:168-3515(-)